MAVMGCCHYYAPSAGGDDAFSIDISAITFGAGVLNELGDHARARGIERIALMTDKVLGGLEHVAVARGFPHTCPLARRIARPISMGHYQRSLV